MHLIVGFGLVQLYCKLNLDQHKVAQLSNLFFGRFGIFYRGNLLYYAVSSMSVK